MMVTRPRSVRLVTVVAKVSLSTMSNSGKGKILNEKNVCSNLWQAEYEGRSRLSALSVRVLEIHKELEAGVEKPFKELFKANIGDAHAMGQRPITFLRQVMTLTICPELLDDPNYPEDVKQRAREALNGCEGSSIGSYPMTSGIEFIRKRIAKFIENRDGVPSDYRNIFMFNGATPGIKAFLEMFCEHLDGKQSGVMIPIPQYPLYAATLTEFGLARINYYLDEENKWGVDLRELERAYRDALKTCNPRVLVVINPGNPTGQVLTRKNIQDVVKFAYEHRLFILADEVYQENVYGDNSFHSFKKVMAEMGQPYANMELVSFMSLSKGFYGECGFRGGCGEFVNMDPKVFPFLTKLISAGNYGNVPAQVAMSVVVNPPKLGEPSYELFRKERAGILKSLAEKSQLVVETLNGIEGFKCNPSMGAMYAFPRFELPEKAIKVAKTNCMEPDIFYAFKLLESTGIYVLAGSCFGQKPGTYHFRTTILQQKDKLISMLNLLEKFHANFLEKYS